MPIPGLPTFTSGTLTAAKLNAIVAALEEKFAAGISTGDVAWPLTAGGDINMGQFSILNVGKFWNAYDASARTAGTTLQATIDLLAADGGGVIIFPGNYTEYVDAAGILVPTNVSLIGDGASSVLSIHASASNGMVRFASGADAGGIRNMRLTGNVSVAQTLLQIDTADDLVIADCWFDTHKTSPFISVIGGSTNVRIDNCAFLGTSVTNAQNMIEVTGSIGLQITDCNFSDWATRWLYAVPAAGTPINSTIVSGCIAKRDVTNGDAIGSFACEFDNSTNTVACSGLNFTDNTVLGESLVGGIKITGGGLVGIIIADNELYTKVISPALLIHGTTTQVVIAGNRIDSLAGDGIVIGLNGGTETTGQTASLVRDIAITGNNVNVDSPTDGAGVALLMAPYTTSVGLRAAITGNRFVSNRSHAIAIWNIGTTKPLYMTISGNSCWADDAYKGFASFQGMGTTAGDIGTAAINWWFTMVGNNISGAVSGVDYTSGSNKTVVQDNNI